MFFLFYEQKSVIENVSLIPAKSMSFSPGKLWGFWRSPRFQWWATSILHIETLFVIGVVILMIYFIWFADQKKQKLYIKQIKKQLFGPLDDLGGLSDVPKKKKRKPRFNKSEERCREIFQDIFDTKFKSVRPDWLKNPVTKQNLELDGFAPNIKTHIGQGLAFEYDGIQHSEYNKHFHRGGPDEFIYQTKKDSWKDLKCKERGVFLVRIPHFVAYQDLERYIKQKLRREGLGKYVDKSGGYMSLQGDSLAV